MNKISKLNGKDITNNSPRKFCDAPVNKLGRNISSNPENPNEEFNNFFNIFKSSVDHNAPLIKLSRKLTKLASKPWITKGLLILLKLKTNFIKKLLTVALLPSFKNTKSLTTY